jgi:hypothetical protein
VVAVRSPSNRTGSSGSFRAAECRNGYWPQELLSGAESPSGGLEALYMGFDEAGLGPFALATSPMNY